MFQHPNIYRLFPQIGSVALILVVLTSCKQESNFKLLIDSSTVPLDVILPIQYSGTHALLTEDFADKNNYSLKAHCISSPPDLTTPEDKSAESNGGDSTTQNKSDSTQKQSSEIGDLEGIDVTNFAIHYDGKKDTETVPGKVIQTVDLILPPLQKGTKYCLSIAPIDTENDDYAYGKTFHFETQGKLKPGADKTTHKSKYDAPSKPEVYRNKDFKMSSGEGDSEKINDLADHPTEDLLNSNSSEYMPSLFGWISEVKTMASASFPLLIRFKQSNSKLTLSPKSLKEGLEYCEVEFQQNTYQNTSGWSTNLRESECKNEGRKLGSELIQIVDVSRPKSSNVATEQNFRSNLALYRIKNNNFSIGKVYKVWFDYPNPRQPENETILKHPALTFLFTEDETIDPNFEDLATEGKSPLEEYTNKKAQNMLKDSGFEKAISFAHIPISDFISGSQEE